MLPIRAGAEAEFEAAFDLAKPLMSADPGCLRLSLSRCIERPREYLLSVDWVSVEAHTVGFRESTAYQEWSRLLHHFYDPLPSAAHFTPVTSEIGRVSE